MVRDRRPAAVLGWRMMIFRTSAGALHEGWLRALSAPATRTGLAAGVLLGSTLALLRFSGLS